MLTNIRVLIAACQELNIDFKFLHSSHNFVQLKINSHPYLFANYTTPFNSEVNAAICKDKGLTYELLKNKVRIPKTISFLSPFCKEKYQKYLTYKNIDSIVEEINKNFSLPVIIKMNSGSLGKNVFLCQDGEQIRSSLEKIFNINSKDYDCIAIAQEYIDVIREYRAIIFNNELLLLYEKNIDNAKFVGILSPGAWEGSKTIQITEEEFITEVERFIQPIFEEISLNYTGADIVIDKNRKIWLLELNSMPHYERFVKDNGEETIVEIFKKMLTSLM